MKTALKIGIGITIAAVAGAVVFLSTREAAAQDAAKEAFKVSPDCSTIELIDENRARDAIIAAGISVLPSDDDMAIDVAEKMFKVLWPQCTLGITTVFKARGQSVPWGLVMLGLVGKTVGQVKKGIEDGTIELPLKSDGSAAPPLALDLLSWIFSNRGAA